MLSAVCNSTSLVPKATEARRERKGEAPSGGGYLTAKLQEMQPTSSSASGRGEDDQGGACVAGFLWQLR